MADLTDSSQKRYTVDPTTPDEASVPDRSTDDIDNAFQEIQEGDNISLTVGYDDSVQDVEMIVDEIRQEGRKLNPSWTVEISCVSKVVPPESAGDLEEEYLQVFVIGVPPEESNPPWFVYSYRVERSSGDEVTFVDPDTGDEYPTSFAHGWVVEVKNFFGGDIQ